MDPIESIGKTELKTNTSKPSVSIIKKYPVLFTAVLGIVAALSIYFWKDIAAKKEKAAIEASAALQITENKMEMLKLLTKPLIWSIRSEMLRGNMEQVNLFTTDLVKEKNFQFIYLVDPEGKIIISTDKKMEGQPADGILTANYANTDSVIVVSENKNMLRVIAPVMGYDKKLATIVFDYAISDFKIENKTAALNDTIKK